jgi:DNA-binding transcriptional MocR family regulator
VQAAQELLSNDESSPLTYGDVKGNSALRKEVLNQYQSYYGAFEPEQLLLTYGITEAISLSARTLLQRDDVVVVEAPTYHWALPEFTSRGARVVQIPVDEHGLRVDLLKQEMHVMKEAGLRVKLIYCMPTFHNPCGVTMSLARRNELLDLAHAYGSVILEDDPYFALRYHGRSLPPLLALDKYDSVIHTSSFSKVIAPGVRIGWLLTRSPLLMHSIMRLKPNGTNPLMAALVLNYLKNNAFAEHLNRIRDFYRKSLEICSASVAKLASLGIHAFNPCGGFYLWLRLPEHWRASDFAKYASGCNVDLSSGDEFFAQAPTEPCVRLAFSSFSHEELVEKLKQLAIIAEKHVELIESETVRSMQRGVR